MKKTVLATAILGFTSLFATTATADVVTSIKPLGFIAAAIANGVTDTKVIVQGNQSPHTYELKPNDLATIKSADLLVFISDDMEISLGQALENNNYRPKNVLELGDLPAIEKHLVKGIHFDHDEDAEMANGDHDHDHHHHHDHDDDDHDHDHDGHMDHDHDHDMHMDKDHDHDAHMDKDHDHDHDAHMDKDHDHDNDHDHDGDEHEHHHHHHHHHHGGLETNYHLWTSPVFAKIIAQNIADRLSAIYPDKKILIQQNLATFNAKLDAATATIKKQLVPSRFQNYLVYHDAYTYFEQDFGIRKFDKGAIYFNVAVPPSIKILYQLRKQANKDHVKVIFSEPQFNRAIAQKLASSINAKLGFLDPLGTDIDVTPNGYPQFLLGLSKDFSVALKPVAKKK